MKEILTDILKKKDVVLFAHHEKIHEENSFSWQAKNLLDCFKIDYELILIDRRGDIYKQILSISKWELFPQLFVKEKFIGGFFIINEFFVSGEYSRITKKYFNVDFHKKSCQKSIWRMKLIENGNVIYCTADSKLCILSCEKKEIINNLNCRWINCFDVNQRLNLIYIGSSDACIYIFNSESFFVKKLTHHNRWVNDIKFDNLSGFCYSVDGDGCIVKWNSMSGDIIHKRKVTNCCIWSLDISKKYICLGDSDGDIYILDQCLNIVNKIEKAHSDCITKIIYISKKDIWMSSSYDKTIKIWSLNLILLNTYKQHSSRVWDIVFLEHINAFSSVSQNMELLVTNIDTFEVIKRIKTIITPTSICYSNKCLIVGGIDGQIEIISINND